MDKTKRSNIAVEEAARNWLVKLYGDDVSENDKQAFKAWLALDAAHAKAYKAVELLWRDMSVFSAASLSAKAPQKASQTGIEVQRRSAAKWSVAAGTAAACLALVMFGAIPSDTAPINSRYYETASGELKTITLEDGSTVTLSAQSRIQSEFSASKRSVKLLNGRAYFNVTSNSSKPFTVSSGETVITVTGTEFDVVLRPSGVQVAVAEGSVNVTDLTPESNLANRGTDLKAGEKIIADLDGSLGEKAGFDLENLLAWQSGHLVYVNTTLGDIINDVNRYRKKPIRLQNQSLAELKITTAFKAKQSDQLLEGLEASYPVTINSYNHTVSVSLKNK